MTQGDGTAAIFAGDPSVFTLSVHCAAQSFPEPGHTSDLDLALPAGTGDEAYMQVSSCRAFLGTRSVTQSSLIMKPLSLTSALAPEWVLAVIRLLVTRRCINQPQQQQNSNGVPKDNRNDWNSARSNQHGLVVSPKSET